MTDKHKVMLFGNKVFGTIQPVLSIDYADVEYVSFPGEFDLMPRLAEYDLVVLDYSAFVSDRGVHYYEQDIFDKEMLDALGRGTNFCFLHYGVNVPQGGGSFQTGYMDRNEIEKCRSKQIGFRWLERAQIRPYWRSANHLNCAKVRAEFTIYQERWGTSRNFFKPFQKGEFGDVILGLDDGCALAFSINVRRGRIVYIPCLRDFLRPGSIQECLTALINGLITYFTRVRTEIPVWAQEPLFTDEAVLNDRLSVVQKSVLAIQEKLEPFREAKGLAFQSEYDFEDAVPEFLENRLGIRTQRDEQFLEDFWILDDQGEKIAIGETKSMVRGTKVSAVYSLHNHREANGLHEDFPGLLVVNAHLNANSWKGKKRNLDRRVSKAAANHNILVLRVEDLLQFWNLVQEGTSDGSGLLLSILEDAGWLEIREDGTTKLHR